MYKWKCKAISSDDFAIVCINGLDCVENCFFEASLDNKCRTWHDGIGSLHKWSLSGPTIY